MRAVSLVLVALVLDYTRWLGWLDYPVFYLNGVCCCGICNTKKDTALNFLTQCCQTICLDPILFLIFPGSTALVPTRP